MQRTVIEGPAMSTPRALSVVHLNSGPEVRRRVLGVGTAQTLQEEGTLVWGVLSALGHQIKCASQPLADSLLSGRRMAGH